MQFGVVTRFIERYIALIGSVLVIGVIALYFLAQLIPGLNDWIVRGGFFNVLAIVLLVDILNRVIALKSATPQGAQVYQNQDKAMDAVLKYIAQQRPKTADLLEYSTDSIQSLLEALKHENTNIRLLMCHPKYALNKLQREVIQANIGKRRDVTFDTYGGIKIKLYRLPASLRGRSLDGKLISLGWYTYQSDKHQVHGHDNAMIVAPIPGPDGEALRAMFDRAFEALWNDPTTIDLAALSSSREPVPGDRAG